MWPRRTANRTRRRGFTQTTYRASADRSSLAHRQSGSRSSPVELGANLTDAWIARIGDDSEAGVGDVSGRIHKLRVVEDVEKFDTKIESIILFNYGTFRHAEIGVVESGTVEEAPVGSPKSSESAVLHERAGGWYTGVGIRDRGRLRRDEVTPRVVGGRAIGISVTRVQCHDLADDIRHIRGRIAGERVITSGLVHLDGKACRATRHSLHLPALGQALRRLGESPVKRDSPNVAGHKIVCNVTR